MCNTDYFGTPTNFDTEDIKTVKELILKVYEPGNSKGFHRICKPPVGVIPEKFVNTETPQKILDRFDDITRALRDYLAAGQMMPEPEDGRTWTEQIDDLFADMVNCKNESEDRSETIFNSLYQLFPELFTQDEVDIINGTKP